ncbi:MAG: type II secretion system protein [Candidatus Subteraquimicrobiales bacterium]|nr:type II secretion system protein [Candidatus Subteraquimicrobiales bacterium]
MKNQKGFSLIEMTVVFLIIAILVAMVVVVYNFSLAKVKDTACRANLRIIRSALEIYRAQELTYPDNLNQLIPDFIKEFNFKCPVIETPYNYDKNNETIECTYGAHADF